MLQILIWEKRCTRSAKISSSTALLKARTTTPGTTTHGECSISLSFTSLVPGLAVEGATGDTRYEDLSSSTALTTARATTPGTITSGECSISLLPLARARTRCGESDRWYALPRYAAQLHSWPRGLTLIFPRSIGVNGLVTNLLWQMNEFFL